MNNAMILSELDKIDASTSRIRELLQPATTEGIDVSLYQGVIDWTKVKTQKAFAFIKATQGDNITDPKFDANWTGAKAAGVQRGAYHYYRFGADPTAQANLFCSKLQTDKGELSPVVDVEDTTVTANQAQLKQFIDIVEGKLGVRICIYTAAWFWNNARWGGAVTWAKDYSLWVANYGVTTPTLPTDWTIYKYWQYSNSGTVAGINGNVDLNRLNEAWRPSDEHFWVAWPVGGGEAPRITDKFDAPRGYANNKHEGTDCDAYVNALSQLSPVLAAQDGTVEYVSNRADNPSYGMHVVIRHPWNGVVDRYRTLYAHMSNVLVMRGDAVYRGQRIGTAGATGTSAVHLHFGVYDAQSGLKGYVRCKDCTGLFPEGVIDPESVLRYG